jgi:hypothetical protein
MPASWRSGFSRPAPPITSENPVRCNRISTVPLTRSAAHCPPQEWLAERAAPHPVLPQPPLLRDPVMPASWRSGFSRPAPPITSENPDNPTSGHRRRPSVEPSFWTAASRPNWKTRVTGFRTPDPTHDALFAGPSRAHSPAVSRSSTASSGPASGSRRQDRASPARCSTATFRCVAGSFAAAATSHRPAASCHGHRPPRPVRRPEAGHSRLPVRPTRCCPKRWLSSRAVLESSGPS